MNLFTAAEAAANYSAAGAGKTSGNMAVRLTVYTLPGHIFGAAASLHRIPFFDHQDFFAAFLPYQLQRGKNPRRSGSYDYDVTVQMQSQHCLFRETDVFFHYLAEPFL